MDGRDLGRELCEGVSGAGYGRVIGLESGDDCADPAAIAPSVVVDLSHLPPLRNGTTVQFTTRVRMAGPGGAEMEADVVDVVIQEPLL